jgi:peptidyl-prolyl cis-trans isomerase C
MYKKNILLLFAFLVIVTGCQPKDSALPEVKRSDAVASINGQNIAKSTFELIKNEALQRSQGREIPDEQLVQELIKMELLVQDAEQKNLQNNPEIMQRMAMVKRGLLSQAAVQDYIKSNPISDAELQAEYDTQINSKEGGEFKARHILLKTEAEAKAIIGELNKGGDFIAIATKSSVGPSATKGGDLGWFAPAQMVPPFSEAVIALENGKYTEQPVQTNFGWHVILREDSREKTPPPFESVKEQLRPMLQRKKVQDYLATLRSKAKIEILLPKKEEPAAADTPPSDAEAEAVKPAETSNTEEKVVAETDEKTAAKSD